MMTRGERAVIDRLYGVLVEIGQLNPPNPMDVTAKLRNLPLATEGARAAAAAITSWRSGEMELVDSHLADAERILALPGDVQSNG